MGMTRLTAIIIKTRGRDVRPSYRESESGKFAGMIELWKRGGGDFDYVLISTESEYKTKEEAVSAMDEIITAIRKDDSL